MPYVSLRARVDNGLLQVVSVDLERVLSVEAYMLLYARYMFFSMSLCFWASSKVDGNWEVTGLMFLLLMCIL